MTFVVIGDESKLANIPQYNNEGYVQKSAADGDGDVTGILSLSPLLSSQLQNSKQKK
jgi:hypothetical protein